jgi:hypothetical protein
MKWSFYSDRSFLERVENWVVLWTEDWMSKLTEILRRKSTGFFPNYTSPPDVKLVDDLPFAWHRYNYMWSASKHQVAQRPEHKSENTCFICKWWCCCGVDFLFEIIVFRIEEYKFDQIGRRLPSNIVLEKQNPYPLFRNKFCTSFSCLNMDSFMKNTFESRLFHISII